MLKPARLFMIAVAISVASSALAQDKDKEEAKKVFKLPRGKKTTVVSLDFQGGFTPPRLKKTPTMSILADGTVQIPANYQGQKSHTGKISADDLQELLRFIIDENKLLEFDAKAIKAKIAKQGGPRIAIADAATTVIRVTVDGKTKQASWYPSPGAKLKELEQFQAIRGRLMRVRSIVELGGKKEALQWVDLANKELKAKHPKVEELKLEHLQSGGVRSNGSVYVSITRIEGDDPNPQKKTVTSVFINKLADKAPMVTVTHRVPK